VGKGIAESLLKAGYACVLVDKNESQLHSTFNSLQAIGTCYEYKLDITHTEAIKQFVEWLKDQSLQVNVLVNNIGYDSSETVLELTPEQMELSNQINLVGPFYLTSLIVREWVDNKIKGSVIFISSTHSKVIRTHPLYSVAKAGLEMFVKEAALELSTHGVRVNAVAPGVVVDTEIPDKNKFVPLGTNQQPVDIGEAVAFMVSDKARFITGETLVVDGGFSLTHTHYWTKNSVL
jgi:NAD(P)-dependent dehydrogenase (short-subunit alcohol dehydrogenase family)